MGIELDSYKSSGKTLDDYELAHDTARAQRAADYLNGYHKPGDTVNPAAFTVCLPRSGIHVQHPSAHWRCRCGYIQSRL